MELQQSYDSIQQERQLLEAELHLCRTELNHLMDKTSQVSIAASSLFSSCLLNEENHPEETGSG